MKKVIALVALVSLFGCASMYKTKKTTFYKNGVVVKTFVGRGIYDGNDWFGTYKIWSLKDWQYYEFTCRDCTYTEEVIQGVR
jgi:hypothetical protein